MNSSTTEIDLRAFHIIRSFQHGTGFRKMLGMVLYFHIILALFKTHFDLFCSLS